MTKRWGLLLMVGFVCACLGGCARVSTTVTSFNVLPANLNATGLYVLPLKKQDGDLEWQAYASSFSKKLSAQGFVIKDSFDGSDYFAFFDYGIGEGTATVSSMPVFGQTGGGTSYQTGTVYAGGVAGQYSGTTYVPPTYGQVGSVPVTKTVYPRYMHLWIADVRKSTTSHLDVVYQAEMKSVGSSDTVAAVAPCMIDALFADFRRENGKPDSYTMVACGD